MAFFREKVREKICTHANKGVNLRLHPWEPADIEEGWWAYCTACKKQLYWVSPKPGVGDQVETQLRAIRAIGGNV